MATEVVTDPEGVAVTITDERWGHIIEKHPEMRPHRTDLSETIQHSNIVYEKDGHRYYWGRVNSPLFGRMFLHTRAIPNPNYFVVTAFLMGSIQAPPEARLVWFDLRPQ